ncbi:hypothetical protein SHPE106448_16675 [Shewanella pealeana]
MLPLIGVETKMVLDLHLEPLIYAPGQYSLISDKGR